MKKEDVVIGGLYCIKGRPSFYEIQTEADNSGQVEGILYTDNEMPVKTNIKISELDLITITEEMLHILSFTDIDGNLEGVPDAHYFELKTESEPIRMIIAKGQFCYVQRMANAILGCKYVAMPYLHQLQVLLAPFCSIDIQKIIKHATPTT